MGILYNGTRGARGCARVSSMAGARRGRWPRPLVRARVRVRVRVRARARARARAMVRTVRRRLAREARTRSAEAPGRPDA